MKKENKSAKGNRNFDELVSKLTENDILTLPAMRDVRGGDGEDNGGEPVIIIPPKET